MTCRAHRTTSQGDAFCHQPDHHTGDHLALVTDRDSTRWCVSWSDRWPKTIQLSTVKIKPGAPS